MKLNMPITDREILLTEGRDLVTKTDLKGAIIYANMAFVEISGYSIKELVGQNHNIVRHPDMPEEAFENLWGTIKLGRPWAKCIKNRCKNGDFYWVKANITPVFEEGVVAGYMSVRTKATQIEVDEAEALYQKIKDKNEKLITPKSINDINLSQKLNKCTLLAIVTMSLISGLVFGLNLAPELLTLGPLSAVAILYISVKKLFVTHVFTPLNEIKDAMVKISEGHYLTTYSLEESGEIGSIKRAVNMLGVKLGIDVGEAKEQSEKNLQTKVALDSVASSVMLTDTKGKIVYVNKSLKNLFSKAQENIATQIEGFDSNELKGMNFNDFNSQASPIDGLLYELTTTATIRVKLGSSTFELIVNPVFDNALQRLGTVLEWQDVSEQLNAEQEVQQLIENAVRGDFEQRIEVSGYTGFMNSIASGVNGLMDSITQPLKEVKRVLESVAQGDLTQKMQGEFQGEFEQLNIAVSTSIANLSLMVSKIRNAGDNIKSGASEIATGNATLSGRTESQAATLEETASSMEEMTGTVRRNADNAEEARKLSESSQQLAIAGGEISNKVITSMSDISESAHKIAEIITVIDEIAFQTNLLALNAAVEAARAGDQGRGFAVVASEVRILAQRSAKAAKEIKVLINESTDKVAEGNTYVLESGKALSDIIKSVQNVTELASEIASSSREQSIGIDQVNTAVNQMDEVVQQNAALVEEVSAASISLDGEAVQLKSLVSAFSVNNTDLKNEATALITNASFETNAKTEQQAGSGRKQVNQESKIYTLGESNEEWQEF